MMRKTPQFGKMFEQMLHNLLLGILRTAPEARRAADIETRDSPVMGDHNLALGEAEPQCAHKTKTLRGMNRPHLHRLRHGFTGTKHRGDHFLSSHIDCRLLPRRNRLE
jgi:hypothetical protein